MKENILKSFFRDTYQTYSPIPYIITVQVLVFVLIGLFELLSFSEITAPQLYSFTFDTLRLPNSATKLLTQPWAVLSHPFVYSGIFNLLFDCLWLYWLGNIFLDFLNKRQFWMIFGGGLLGGMTLYLLFGQLQFLNKGSYWHTTSFGLGALISSIGILLPTYEVRLLLFGTIKLRIIILAYLLLNLIFISITNLQASIPFLLMAAYGAFFILQLKKGNDWSNILRFTKCNKSRLKVVHKNQPAATKRHKNPNDLPNQEEIDEILDKISQNGYENLTSREKEILFRASKQDI